MKILIVHIHVKPECIAEFKEATIANASNSALEPGVARFDFFQQEDDPARFVLVEVYRDEQAVLSHKETAHYLEWREKVVNMMAEQRYGIRYGNVYPDDKGW